MGLEHYKIESKSRGGRPKEKNKGTREPDAEDPHTRQKDSKEWWQSIYNQYVGDDELETEHVTEMAKHTALLPRSVRRYLQKHGIHDFDLDGNVGSVPSDVKSQSGGISITDSDDSDSKFSGIKSMLNKD